MFEDLKDHKNQVIYSYGDVDTTNPSEVTGKTRLDELNLNWAEKDLPEKVRTKHVHRLHPYLGKFIPQIVEIFLRKYFKKGDTVTDPFLGCGTTAVQAKELGINCVGSDISEFNILISRVKTNDYDVRELEKELKDILKRTAKFTGNEKKDLFNELEEKRAHNQNPSDFLEKWFADRALFELLTYKSLIEEYEYQDIMKVILSRSARSARLTTHYDLDFPKEPQTEPYKCYKHGKICTPVDESFKFLKRYTKDTIKRVKEFDKISHSVNIDLYNADSRYLEFPESNGVITSPPYIGLIDYHEQHRYSYELLDLKDRREKEIGSASKGKSKQAKENFKNDLVRVFNNVKKSIKKGGKLIIVAGDKENLYDEIQEEIDMELEGKIERHVNRRTGRRNSKFYESVFIFTK